MSTAHRQQVLTRVAADLLADHRALPVLLDHLEALNGALARHDQGQVDALNGAIRQALDAMTERAQRRERVLSANRLARKQDGMLRLLACYPTEQAQRLLMAWSEMKTMLQACRQLNERNGRLLAAQCELVDRWLAEPVYAPG
jgi:flagella synthesis protein FlgN